jgi:hypothetical protein
LLGHSIVSQHSKEPEDSIPNLQELSTCSYPEPDQSSPHHPIPRLQKSILILSTHLRFGLPLFPIGFPTNNLCEFLFTICATCSVYLILFDLIFLIVLGEEYNLEALRYAVFSTLPSPHLSPNILLSTLFSNALILCSSLNVSDQVSHPYRTKDKIGVKK